MYRRLLSEIRDSVASLKRIVDGAHPRPEMGEELWDRI